MISATGHHGESFRPNLGAGSALCIDRGQTDRRQHQRLDRPVILAYLMVVVVLFAAINLTVGLLYPVLDPRMLSGMVGDQGRDVFDPRQAT